MRLGRSLIGNPVINTKDGRQLGKVEDLCLDSDLTTVAGIYLGSEGLIRRTPIFIRRRDITLFGIDAVLAQEATIVYRGDEIPTAGRWVRLRDLEGREVGTPGGTKIGRIRDVVLDARAQVTGFSLGQIVVEGPIAESKVVAQNALVNVGQASGAMTIDLAIAERETLTIDPDALMFGQPGATAAPSPPPSLGD